MANHVKEVLAETAQIDGFIAVAVAHGDGVAGGKSEFNIEIAVAANSRGVKARAMKALNLSGSIEGSLITLDTQYQIIRPLHENSIHRVHRCRARSWKVQPGHGQVPDCCA